MMHILEMGTVGRVLGHNLRMHRFTLRAPGELRIGAVIGRRIGLELREFPEDVGHLPLRLLAVGLMPDEHASVLFAHRIHA